jgi:hypothetical protein
VYFISCYFRMKTVFGLSLLIFVCMGFCFICYLYLFTYIGVQHDFHITRCLCRLIVTRWVPLVEQKPFQKTWVHHSLPAHIINYNDKTLLSNFRIAHSQRTSRLCPSVKCWWNLITSLLMKRTHHLLKLWKQLDIMKSLILISGQNSAADATTSQTRLHCS